MADITYEGVIATPVETDQSAGGKTYCRFTLKTSKNHKLVPCVAWTHMCQHIADFDLLKKNAKLIVKGFYGKKQQADIFGETASNPKELVLKWFGAANVQETEERPWIDRYIEYCGGKVKAEQCYKRFLKEKRNIGQVYAEIDENKNSWKRKEDCVRYNGQWLYRIWYLQLILTPEYVNKVFKKFMKGRDLGTKADIPAYHAFLDALLKKAVSYAPLDEGFSLK